MRPAPFVALLAFGLLLPAALAGCAKKREDPQRAAAPVVKPASSVQCNFESAVASAKLEVDVLSLDLDILDNNPFQPRTDMDPTELDGLAASLDHSGQIQPIASIPTLSIPPASAMRRFAFAASGSFILLRT